MISAFVNCFKIPELRSRIFYTLLLLFIARVGANIPLPGFDPRPLQEFFENNAGNSLIGLYNMFTGGALLKGAIFALGIMPYISAAIIFQLLGAVLPSLARLQQEGEVGRQKIQQYTRYATIAICVVQGLLLIITLERNPQALAGPEFQGDIILVSHFWFLFTSVIFLTCGTIILMYLGEQITQRGIGNGISILITVGILADLPGALGTLRGMIFHPIDAAPDTTLAPISIVPLVILLLVVIAGLVCLTQGVRKIPVQHAKRHVGRRVYQGRSSFLPLKVNYANVMPIIFASAIILFFQQIFTYLGGATQVTWIVAIGGWFQQGAFAYYVLYSLMILAFAYFWVSIQFKPVQIADDLKKNGGYVPGVRPGTPTAQHLDYIMTRLTFFGAAALVLVATAPDALLFQANIPYRVAQFFGGTGMLIAVGVSLDTLRQIESFLLQRHYDGFLKKGRIRGRSQGATKRLVESGDVENTRTLWISLLAMFGVGFVAYLLNIYFFG